MHYAAANVKSTRYDGSPNPLALPETFDEAQARVRRAVIISAMLPLDPDVYEAQAEKIERGDPDPCDYYCRARAESGAIINKAVGKLSLALMAPGRAVVPMTAKNAATIIDRTRSQYFKGNYHGPCNNHYPQNSIAVMTGLLEFGVNRLPFRDEVWPDGSVRRLCGQYASIIVFDEDELVADEAGGVSLLNADRLAWLRRVNDYTDVASEVVGERFCTYNLATGDGTGACAKCLEACPSGALANSSPGPDGTFDERVSGQQHRFAGGALKFDFATCCRDRGQKGQLYDEYVCARCEAICAARGVRRAASEVQTLTG
jgi:ferredoxin